MTIELNEELPCAAESGDVRKDWDGAEMEECYRCGRGVRWDLRDHYFFGFKVNCPSKAQKAVTWGRSTPPQGGET